MELAALTSTAAGRLIDLLATDGWAAVKSGIVSLWRRSHPERVDAELSEARDELMQAEQNGDDADLRGLLVTEWQARLARLLATHPDLADEVRRLLSEQPHDGGSTGQQVVGSMTQKAHVTGGGDAYVAGRDQTINRGGTG
ncbi:hypothetical protein ABT168_09580 [Streptomyces sp. NPDC001793]|uniref:hypothetical protein n=1 Tax=Streptomyces sp. NPDC001793 TaxID=3154657 RepID=UPI00332DA13F